MDWSSAAAPAVLVGALIVAGLSYRHAVRSSRRQRTAELHAETLAMRHPDGQEDELDWRITNEGPAIARQVQLLVKSPYASTCPLGQRLEEKQRYNSCGLPGRRTFPHG